MQKKKSLYRRFVDFMKMSFREYDKTVQYGASHNQIAPLQGPFDYRVAF